MTLISNFNTNVGRRTTGVIFRSISFNEVSAFHDQGFRPYTANNDTNSIVENALDMLSERRSKNFGRFSPDTIGSFTDNMIGVVAESTGIIGIDNGWKTTRYMFRMVVDVQMSSGGVMNYIVTGFTDTNNINCFGNNVSIDPNILLHITNIAEGTPSDSGLFIKRSDQVLTRQHYVNNNTSNNGGHYYSQRPVDVFTTMTANMFKNDKHDTRFINSETSLGTPVFGNRFNNVPNYYATNIFNSYVEAANTNAPGAGENYYPEVAELTNTKSASEAYISHNKFIEYLNSGNDLFTTQTSFHWKDIESIDPHVMDRVHINLLRDRESFLPSSGLITAPLTNRSDLLGQIASVLASSIPALANKFNLEIVGFFANNMFGEHNIQLDPCTMSFNPTTLRYHGDQFTSSLPSQVLDSLFNTMSLVYEMQVYCQVYAETFISLKVHGLGEEDFLIPTFAESLYTPTVTNTAQTIDTISDTVKFVTARISEETSAIDSLPASHALLERIASNKTPSYGSFGNNETTFGTNQITGSIFNTGV